MVRILYYRKRFMSIGQFWDIFWEKNPRRNTGSSRLDASGVA
jgi:hypothetical protein